VLVEATVNPEARFDSILFDRPPDRGEHDDQSMFSDLNVGVEYRHRREGSEIARQISTEARV
jgi:hypothetical protein